MDCPKSNKQWFALRVKSRHEKKVFSALENSGFSASLPQVLAIRQWSDRKKKVRLPLFRGYVFLKIDLEMDRFDVLNISGVVQFVGIRGVPIPIPEQQMYWLDLIIQQETATTYSEFPDGAQVKIIHGPFRGLEGTVVKKKSRARLVVWFDAIMQGLAIDIDQHLLAPRSARYEIAGKT